jgi:transposase-like protein
MNKKYFDEFKQEAVRQVVEKGYYDLTMGVVSIQLR